MAEDRDALLQHYRQMRADLLAAIDGLSDEQLSDPSLDGWSVAHHLLHLALWDNIRAAEVARISAGHRSAWRMNGDQEAAFSTLGHELRAGLSAAQARWELTTSGQRLLDALAAAAGPGLDGARYGEAGLRSTHEAVHTGWIERWRREQGI